MEPVLVRDTETRPRRDCAPRDRMAAAVRTIASPISCIAGVMSVMARASRSRTAVTWSSLSSMRIMPNTPRRRAIMPAAFGMQKRFRTLGEGRRHPLHFFACAARCGLRISTRAAPGREMARDLLRQGSEGHAVDAGDDEGVKFRIAVDTTRHKTGAAPPASTPTACTPAMRFAPLTFPPLPANRWRSRERRRRA